LSGCVDGTGDGGGGEEASDGNGDADGDDGEELPEGVSEEEFERGPVPEEYRTALSLGREERDPDDLTAKADVGFSEYDEADEYSLHEPGMCCVNCADYIPDKNGDTFGACAEVEGYIAVEDWCGIWEHISAES